MKKREAQPQPLPQPSERNRKSVCIGEALSKKVHETTPGAPGRKSSRRKVPLELVLDSDARRIELLCY